MAGPIVWNTASLAEREVYVELLDGDTGGAYAWIAVGRFSVDALNPSRLPENRRLAADLIARFQLREFRPQLGALLRRSSGASESTLAFARSLAALNSDSRIAALAEAVGVPDVIVQKKPSADLWAGQTDEGELGFSYREVDKLLYLMVDRRYSREELVDAGFPERFVDDITLRIMNSQFKRRLPVIAKVSHRTIDRDFRYARDWGK